MLKITFVSGISLLLTVGSGCEVGIIDSEPTTVSVSAASKNGLSVNGLRAHKIHMYSLGSDSLTYYGKESLNGLDENLLALNLDSSDGIEKTAAGRSVLKYIATCTLAEDQELVVDYDGTTYYYPGLLNLAPEWVDGKCEEECQHWVSACLLAHTNPRGENVRISLRGSHSSLRASGKEREKFSFEEGSFYGQLFSDEPELFTCVSDAFTQPTGSDGLLSRTCSRDSGECGAEFMGTCSASSPVPACKSEHYSYSGCTTDLRDSGAKRYNEVITVFLEPSDVPVLPSPDDFY